MCFASSSSSSTEALVEQLNKNNATLSVEKTAGTVSDKKTTKRTVSSLRVPLTNKTDTEGTGTTTTDVTEGLNIPV